MAKFKVTGIDVAFSEFGEIAKDSEGIAKMAVYDGAKVLADAVKKNINALPTRDPKTHKGKKGATPEEKAALQRGFGIAQMRSGGGSIDTVLGFEGYDSNTTPRYPQGHPIPMIARTIESGTSWLTKTPFIKPAIASSKGQAEEAMARRFDEEISKRSK